MTTTIDYNVLSTDYHVIPLAIMYNYIITQYHAILFKDVHVVNRHAIPLSLATMYYIPLTKHTLSLAITSTTSDYHVLLLTTTQYHAIPCSIHCHWLYTMHCHWLPCSTTSYHVLLRTLPLATTTDDHSKSCNTTDYHCCATMYYTTAWQPNTSTGYRALPLANVLSWVQYIIVYCTIG